MAFNPEELDGFTTFYIFLLVSSILVTTRRHGEAGHEKA